MEYTELIPHLFRTEYRKIVAVLYKHFGFEGSATAEDIASDTFAAAAQLWPLKGVPNNPVPWLYQVAKNKARNHVARHNHFAKTVTPAVQLDNAGLIDEDIDLSTQHIADSQLKMMFALCHPSIPPQAQIGLALRILCGFGFQEIADAFLSSKETVNKRLYRAKEKLREKNIRIELPSNDEIGNRLENVLTTIYLLFNEGYYSLNKDSILQKELCFEAIRLCHMLTEKECTDLPKVNALLALMCFHASRFESRIGRSGEIVLYDDQDVSLWDAELISRGAYFMHRAAKGNEVSRYHLEALIAFWFTQKPDNTEKWQTVIYLYDKLLQINPTPVAALNRIYALYKVNGKAAALTELDGLIVIKDQFYYTLQAELYEGLDNKRVKASLQQALNLARTEVHKRLILNKLGKIHV